MRESEKKGLSLFSTRGKYIFSRVFLGLNIATRFGLSLVVVVQAKKAGIFREEKREVRATKIRVLFFFSPPSRHEGKKGG